MDDDQKGSNSTKAICNDNLGISIRLRTSTDRCYRVDIPNQAVGCSDLFSCVLGSRKVGVKYRSPTRRTGRTFLMI